MSLSVAGCCIHHGTIFVQGDLGFDRTRDLSTQSAQEIAEAARAWGQNDDITVVTVRRNA